MFRLVAHNSPTNFHVENQVIEKKIETRGSGGAGMQALSRTRPNVAQRNAMTEEATAMSPAQISIHTVNKYDGSTRNGEKVGNAAVW